MSTIKSYKDLLIWQKAFEIVISSYKLVKTFPQEELYALTSQIKRAAISISSNIAEGYGRNTDKSFSHFIDISRGSLYELETQLHNFHKFKIFYHTLEFFGLCHQCQLIQTDIKST